MTLGTEFPPQISLCSGRFLLPCAPVFLCPQPLRVPYGRGLASPMDGTGLHKTLARPGLRWICGR